MLLAPLRIKSFFGKVENKLAIANCSIRCIIGDFNSVTKASERKGLNCGAVNNGDNARFNEFIAGAY